MSAVAPRPARGPRSPRRGRGRASAPAVDTRRARIGWTDHALERFCERGGVPVRPRDELERVLTDLVRSDGRIVHDRPRWAASKNDADLFVQIGRWLLVVLMADERRGEHGYSAVTILGREGVPDWAFAHAHGLVGRRPPRWARPHRPLALRIADWLARRRR
ncbi:hypothetical protein [Patulibacter sp. SYSU D01012]|uniref:hypothetical protein n=1 Tax=Patulibacter sp. SYSU D01012 TaxID=2817381 RepID=UPI001B30C5AF|nr:hypothetical protein [Patulibacter sp. SYSU D01012]